MTEYTPTTMDVRTIYVVRRMEDVAVADLPIMPTRQWHDEFDRWLTEHDRQVAAHALRDAAEEPEVLGVPGGNARIWLNNRADSLVPALAAPDEGAPFFRDLTTKTPCPRRGRSLCTIEDPEHLHSAIHMDAPGVSRDGR